MHWFHQLSIPQERALLHVDVMICGFKNRFKYDLRKYCFTNRVVNIWNSLPNYVVSANTTNVFKNRKHKFWQDQEIICDYKAQLEGTGSRSGVE